METFLVLELLVFGTTLEKIRKKCINKHHKLNQERDLDYPNFCLYAAKRWKLVLVFRFKMVDFGGLSSSLFAIRDLNYNN